VAERRRAADAGDRARGGHEPGLLLLDEPSEGLAPRLVETLVEQLKTVQGAGLAMLLAEQHAGLVKELASRVYVLERGRIRAGGDATALPERE
jgi:branched-chain amino acid transport system ATP-binding protein